MNAQTYFPTEALKPFVKAYQVIECDDDTVNRVLPGTGLVLSFRYKGRVNVLTGPDHSGLPTIAVSGLRKSVRLFNYCADSGNILVLFNEAGAASFFREPLHELFDASIGLDSIIAQRRITLLEEQLTEARHTAQRVALIDTFLLSRLREVQPDKLIGSAVQTIKTTRGATRIKTLADNLCISQDAFEKRFRKTVGTSPKQFSSIIRMRTLINRYPQTSSLLDLAFDAGYFDQAHFHKEFKRFTGQVPTDFFDSQTRYW